MGVVRGAGGHRSHEVARVQNLLGPQPPFRLSRHANGQLMLTDTSSGKRIALEAFGSANVGAFARLMTAGAKT